MRELGGAAAHHGTDRFGSTAPAVPGKSTLTSQLSATESVAPAVRALPRLELRPPPNTDSDRPAGESVVTAPSESVPQPGASPQDGTAAGPDSDAPPAEQYVIPFDRNPKSSPGEQIIFGATYTHATPNQYKLVYTSAGGHFDSQGSGVTTKTFPGLSKRNLDWYIASNWDGRTAVTMKLEVQKLDGTVVATTNWTFSKKAYQPTTIAQDETEGERDNPAVYHYKVGPSRGSRHDDYIGFTILEEFGTYRSNLTVADIKPAYAQANGLDTDEKVAAHFFAGSSSHGTFTVSAGDKIADQHSGMAGGNEARAQLAAPKQVEKILDQTYESEPGTALGRYTITRIMKTDGTKKITKKKI